MMMVQEHAKDMLSFTRTDEEESTDVNIWEDEADTAENIVWAKRTVRIIREGI